MALKYPLSRTKSTISIHKPLVISNLNLETYISKPSLNLISIINDKSTDRTKSNDSSQRLTKYFSYKHFNHLRKSQSSPNIIANNTFISVYCRFRPINQIEYNHTKNISCINTLSDNQISIHSDTSDFTQNFSFDRIFPISSTQEEVFSSTSKDIIDSVVKGYNGTIMAYGQTSSGKTYTMKGENDSIGIIPRSIKEIFSIIDKDNSYKVRVSFLEIYMEKIRDLFDLSKTNLTIQETRNKQIVITDLTWMHISNENEFNNIYRKACNNITTSSTYMNEDSSRSHSIMIVKISNTLKRTAGKLNLVDLAGSEKTSKTHCKGINLEEAKIINKSLLQLGLIIKVLTDNQSSHVPYRDSKLTRILAESIGGNSKTSLILTCSPSMYNYDETMSTIRFGVRAKKIRNKPIINKEETKAELKMKIDEISKELELKDLYIQKLLKQRKREVNDSKKKEMFVIANENQCTYIGIDKSNKSLYVIVLIIVLSFIMSIYIS